MALDQAALLEVLDARTVADDRIRQATQTIDQTLIEAELTAVIGAAPTSASLSGWLSATATGPGVLSTTTGDLELRIPKLRAGSFSPAC